MPFQLKKNTINEFQNRVVEVFHDRPFLFYADERPLTYGEYGKSVLELRKKLVATGLKKGDRVGILGPASPHWAISFMAIMTAGMVSVPIMEDFPFDDINHIIADSGARCCFIDPAILTRAKLDAMENICLLSLKDFSEIQKMSLLFSSEEAAMFVSDPSTVHLEADSVYCFDTSADDVAELLYTSGTTGHSKAVLLTHNNLVTNLYEGTDLIDDCFDENSILISLLPMAHSFGSTSAFLSVMYKGPRICFLKRKPTPEYLEKVFATVKPTILGGVPLIFEKIHQKKILPLINSHPILRAFTSIKLFRKIFHRLAGRAVLSYFGGKVKCIIIGGANFSHSVETFMKEARIPYVLGYGLTETSPLLTFSSLKDARFGSVGKAIRKTEIRITQTDPQDIGEIEVRGPQVMKGYYKKPKETEEAFTEDGWFKTGDRGCIDGEGYLFIKGRSKNVIIGNSGENIYPEVIETLLNAYPSIEESLVVQRENMLQALVYPEEKSRENHALPELLEEIRLDLNKRLPGASRIHRMVVQKEEFIKTPTRKIKRANYIALY